ncbi:MAG: glutaminyl-peptide cyclotransferase [Tissierellia bacterium]|nr:glutaminyl-peptide cyclotransferase [Tissierellia bacterium]
MKKKKFLIIILLVFAICSCNTIKVKPKDVSKNGIKILNIYRSSNDAFVQGFEMIDEGKVLVGTGKYGESKIGIWDKEKQEISYKVNLDEKYFGEGITVTDKGIWQLTWKEKTAFLRDKKSFEILYSKRYETEGWGIAYDKDRDILLMSDGTNTVYLRDPITFELKDKFELFKEGNPVSRINELEYFDGYLYANIWQTNKIVKINLQSKSIESIYDFTEVLNGLDLSPEQRSKMDVLNGIAHIEENKFYITGKLYPVIIEVELN